MPQLIDAASASPPIRLGVVLSGGGLRGVAHLGVLRQLLAQGLSFDVMVGVSAGAIIAGFYAGVGISVEDMIRDAPVFKGRHLLIHGLALRAPVSVRPLLGRLCGVIPDRLRQLELATFETLHHGVQQLGIVCHDLVTKETIYYSSHEHFGVSLSAVVKGSAAVPGLMPPRQVTQGDRTLQLVDGGISDSLPAAFATAVLGATHLVVSDCRRGLHAAPSNASTVYIRPDLDGAGFLHAPADRLFHSIARGERAVTPAIVDTVRSWMAAHP